MARYDRVDEAVIHASPEDVWSALREEFGGETHWWLPDLGFRPGGASARGDGRQEHRRRGSSAAVERRSPVFRS